MSQEHVLDKQAVIVCTHVAREGMPILRARLDELGWQFLCGSGAFESEATAQIWGLHEVVARDPSVASLLQAVPECIFLRDNRESPWRLADEGVG